MNAYAKFRGAGLRIKKALGIFRELGANYKKILRLSYDVIMTYDNRKSNLR